MDGSGLLLLSLLSLGLLGKGEGAGMVSAGAADDLSSVTVAISLVGCLVVLIDILSLATYMLY